MLVLCPHARTGSQEVLPSCGPPFAAGIAKVERWGLGTAGLRSQRSPYVPQRSWYEQSFILVAP